MSQDSTSKDSFFSQLAKLADEMTAQYGQDFAMGSLVLAARFIAERKVPGAPSAQQDSSPQTM